MNNELERIWKEEVVAFCLEWLRKIVNISVRKADFLSEILNRELLKTK
jgi:hypothetical protein